jgi:hypothetical protein
VGLANYFWGRWREGSEWPRTDTGGRTRYSGRRKPDTNLDQGLVGSDAFVRMRHTARKDAGDAPVQLDVFERTRTRCLEPLEMPLPPSSLCHRSKREPACMMQLVLCIHMLHQPSIILQAMYVADWSCWSSIGRCNHGTCQAFVSVGSIASCTSTTDPLFLPVLRVCACLAASLKRLLYVVDR